jgi:hypothetical protein
MRLEDIKELARSNRFTQNPLSANPAGFQIGSSAPSAPWPEPDEVLALVPDREHNFQPLPPPIPAGEEGEDSVTESCARDFQTFLDLSGLFCGFVHPHGHDGFESLAQLAEYDPSNGIQRARDEVADGWVSLGSALYAELTSELDSGLRSFASSFVMYEDGTYTWKELCRTAGNGLRKAEFPAADLIAGSGAALFLSFLDRADFALKEALSAMVDFVGDANQHPASWTPGGWCFVLQAMKRTARRTKYTCGDVTVIDLLYVIVFALERARMNRAVGRETLEQQIPVCTYPFNWLIRAEIPLFVFGTKSPIFLFSANEASALGEVVIALSWWFPDSDSMSAFSDDLETGDLFNGLENISLHLHVLDSVRDCLRSFNPRPKVLLANNGQFSPLRPSKNPVVPVLASVPDFLQVGEGVPLYPLFFTLLFIFYFCSVAFLNTKLTSSCTVPSIGCTSATTWDAERGSGIDSKAEAVTRAEE